jgi:diguanylate cyclase (GGDEF)-like protein/PAS domain S-box-containing protein
MAYSTAALQSETGQHPGFADPYLGISLTEALGLFLLLMSVHLMSNYNYLLFHSAAELFSIFIAITIGIIVINCWRSIENQYVLFIGLGYFFIGLLDVLHTLTYKGMPIFKDYDYYAPQFWIAARYLEATIAFLGFAFLGTNKKVNGTLAVGGLSIVTVGLISSILYFKNFPVCFVPGQGLTPFKVISEYIICSLMLVNLGLLYLRRGHFDPKIYRLISWSVILMIAMELCFTLYVSDTMSDAFNQAGHLLKIGTFYLIYKAVVVTALRDPLNLLFRELSKKEAELESRVIERTNMLAESESRFRTMADSAPVLIWISGRDKQGFWFNKVWLDFTGRTMEQEVGQGWTSGLHPDDLDHCLQIYDSAFDARQKFELEYRLRRFDGEYRWLAVTGVPRFDQHGQFSGYIGSCLDIADRKRTEQSLIRQSEKNIALLQNASDGITIMDVNANVIEVSESFCVMLGYSRGELIGMNVSQWDCGFNSKDELLNVVREQFAHPKRSLFQTRHRRKDGSIYDVEISGYPIQLDGSMVLFNSARDITQRKRDEEKLQLAASVFTHAREGIMITDPDGTVIEVNDTFAEITGHCREEVIGQNPRILSSGRHDKSFYSVMWGTLTSKGHWSGEIWNRRKNGEVYAEMLTISEVRDENGNILRYVALFSDITANKEDQRQLEHLAHFDALTHLPNRVLLADRLQQAMLQAQRRGQIVAIAYLDFDAFKSINDRHGHEVGDKLLVALASAMKSTMREGDTLARIGGDEFVAVLIDLQSIESSVPLLTRLLEAASAPVQVDQLALQSSASVGVTFYPQAQDIDADQLFRQADQAMYQAKLAGKNRYHVFDAAQDSTLRGQHESIERIRVALARREFVLFYQPKVNMQSGKVIGVEALIRWQHPEKGLLAPANFLPAIEDHPLAVDVGEWVIDTALTQIEVWQAVGLDLPISVNVGARQLQQSNFFNRFQSILAKHPRVNPASLELEVLETSALADIALVSHVIEDCAQIGVKFALDDFGTGYSSLAYLKRLRVALLKIDQSFVRDMLDDPNDLAILVGIIGLANAFNREVIAEGVETVEHGTVLLRLGCQLAQGYGISRPMAAEKMPAWAATWKPDAAWCALTGTGSASQSKVKRAVPLSGPTNPELCKELQQLQIS